MIDINNVEVATQLLHQNILDNRYMIKKPILIFVNKSDTKKQSFDIEQSVASIEKKLKLEGSQRRYFIVFASAKTGIGIEEGLEWLVKQSMLLLGGRFLDSI